MSAATTTTTAAAATKTNDTISLSDGSVCLSLSPCVCRKIYVENHWPALRLCTVWNDLEMNNDVPSSVYACGFLSNESISIWINFTF